MTRRPNQLAFTLIELVLVLLVLALMMAVATPSLRGWSRGGKMRNATDEVLAAAQWARSRAVADARVYRVEVAGTPAMLEVKTQRGGAFVAAAGEFGRGSPLPEGIRIEIERLDGSEDAGIDFQPNGRISPVRITIASDWGDTAHLEAAAPAEPLRAVAAQVTR